MKRYFPRKSLALWSPLFYHRSSRFRSVLRARETSRSLYLFIKADMLAALRRRWLNSAAKINQFLESASCGGSLPKQKSTLAVLLVLANPLCFERTRRLESSISLRVPLQLCGACSKIILSVEDLWIGLEFFRGISESCCQFPVLSAFPPLRGSRNISTPSSEPSPVSSSYQEISFLCSSLQT